MKLSFGILSPYLCLNALQALNWKNLKGLPLLSPVFQGSLFFVFVCLYVLVVVAVASLPKSESYCFHLVWFPLVSSRRVNLVLVRLSWPEVRNRTSERNKWL